MGVLQRFERKLEGLVNGAFARAFKAEVQPVEIAAALQRELNNNAQIVSRQHTLVPNVFTVELSQHDFSRITPFEEPLSRELVGVVKEHADLQHYAFTGPVSVTFAEQDDLATGQFRIRSEVKAAVDRGGSYHPTDTVERRAVAYLDVNGTQHPLVSPGLVVGRSSDCDLKVEDPGVSRRHAEIRVIGNDEDAQLVVVDLGSTNGTVVDGVRVTQAPLSDGSRIVLGSTVLVVHRRMSRR